MKVGLQIPSFTWPGGSPGIAPKLAEIASTAEDVGFESLWVMDHFFQLAAMGEADEPMLEGYTALAFLAAHTHTASLGTLVTGVTYRHPAILVKTATTLDVLSGGRAWLGIGAAWYEREHEGLGVPFPPMAERFERLEEALQIAKQMWSGNVVAYEGKYAQLSETICQPAPVSSPHPRIMIGGLGEKKTLRLVAQYADAWNGFDYVGPEGLAKKRDVLRAHCDAVGRDFDEIECTALSTVHLATGEQSPGDVIEKLTAYRAAGFTHVIVNMPNVHEIEPLETMGREVIAEVASL